MKSYMFAGVRRTDMCLCVIILCICLNYVSASNRFEVWLKEEKVHVFEPAIKDIGVNKCSSEWGVYGTYCTYESVKQFAIRDRKDIAHSRQSYTRSSRNVAQLFVEMANSIEISEKTGNSASAKAPMNDPFYSVLLDIKQDRNSSLTIMKRIMDNYGSFYSNANVCWEKITRIRSSSLCGMCSGRNEEFFVNDKALVSEHICKEVIGECQGFFKIHRDFFKALLLIEDPLVSFLSIRKNKDLIGFIQKMRKSLEIVKRSKVSKSIMAYEWSNKDNNGAETATLCKKMLKLHEITYIDIISKFMKEVEKIFKEVRDTIVQESQNRKEDQKKLSANKKNNWSFQRIAFSRSLQLKPEEINSNTYSSIPLQNPSNTNPIIYDYSINCNTTSLEIPPSILNSDVEMVINGSLVLNVDSSYTSYIGALGTKGNEGFNVLLSLPINTSLILP